MSDLFQAAQMDLKAGPDWVHETRMAREIGGGFICGVDEVGRGPLAGPVVAAAVILDPDQIPKGLNDSKKLTAKKRQLLVSKIEATALSISVAEASVAEIDEINILQASMLAMRRAVAGLDKTPRAALVDGNRDPLFEEPASIICQTIVKGDARSLSIAAASIIAKEYRDQLMTKLAEAFPYYGWETNAGYGTKVHMAGLKDHGPTVHHRSSFAPIAALLRAQS